MNISVTKYESIGQERKQKKVKKRKKKRIGSHYVGQATNRRLFTGAIPLLLDTGTLACCVSALGRFIPP